MLENYAGYKLAGRHFGIDNSLPKKWKKVYETKGFKGFYKEKKAKKKSKVRPPTYLPKENETLEEEVARLRMENEYLKKVRASLRTKLRRSAFANCKKLSLCSVCLALQNQKILFDFVKTFKKTLKLTFRHCGLDPCYKVQIIQRKRRENRTNSA
jgi:transposase-like protein